MKTAVKYNKSTRMWEAHNGKGFEESKNKRRVLLYALKQDYPELWQCVHGIACRCSQDGNGKGIPLTLIDRLIRACQLITKGKIFKEGVFSQNGGNRLYHTWREGTPPTWKCECKDFKKGGFGTVAYGIHCKHTFAQLIAYFVGLKLKPYSPAKPEFANQADFIQGMDDLQARRMGDPKYLKALEKGGNAVFWYLYQEILSEYTQKLYWRTQDEMRISEFLQERPRISDRSKEVTAREIHGHFFRGHKLFRIFEIPELDGARYEEFWGHLWEYCHNGQRSRLKEEMIEAYEKLL